MLKCLHPGKISWETCIASPGIALAGNRYITAVVLNLLIKASINRVRGLFKKVFAGGFRTDSDKRARSVRKNRRQILSRTDRANEVSKTFIIWLLVHFLLCL